MLLASRSPHLALDRPHLFTHPRHHLADEAKAEQRNSRDHEHHDQVEERAETEVRGAKAQVERHEADNQAEQEQHGSDDAEEQRLEIDPIRADIDAYCARRLPGLD